MNKTLVNMKDICKTYYMGKISLDALKNINLNVEKGEYIAILGPSGSGKSTLMQIIGCLSTSTSGSYYLSGQEVNHLTPNQLARIRGQKIGFVFQCFNLLAQYNIVENVALPLMYQGVSPTEREKRAKELLEKLGLGQHFKHHANELSGGQKQRVAIARALVTHPDIILADEPTGNLDSQSGTEVIEIFEQLHSQGKTIIMVTHDLNIAKRAERIVEICDGKLVK